MLDLNAARSGDSQIRWSPLDRRESSFGHAVEEIDDAGFQAVFGADDQQAVISMSCSRISEPWRRWLTEARMLARTAW